VVPSSAKRANACRWAAAGAPEIRLPRSPNEGNALGANPRIIVVGHQCLLAAYTPRYNALRITSHESAHIVAHNRLNQTLNSLI
jgi:hypothetical protein